MEEAIVLLVSVPCGYSRTEKSHALVEYIARAEVIFGFAFDSVMFEEYDDILSASGIKIHSTHIDIPSGDNAEE
jgi:hypothetical protein